MRVAISQFSWTKKIISFLGWMASSEEIMMMWYVHPKKLQLHIYHFLCIDNRTYVCNYLVDSLAYTTYWFFIKMLISDIEIVNVKISGD